MVAVVSESHAARVSKPRSVRERRMCATKSAGVREYREKEGTPVNGKARSVMIDARSFLRRLERSVKIANKTSRLFSTVSLSDHYAPAFVTADSDKPFAGLVKLFARKNNDVKRTDTNAH
jgi:hypothetical protein